MKVTVDIDCTPEEARRFMGLPDMAPVHDAYLGRVIEAAKKGNVTGDMLESMLKNWMPMGEAGMKLFSSLMTAGSGTSSRSDHDGTRKR